MGGCLLSVLSASQCQGPLVFWSGDVADYRLESALGAYPFGEHVHWDFPVGVERETLIPTMTKQTNCSSKVNPADMYTTSLESDAINKCMSCMEYEYAEAFWAPVFHVFWA